MFVMHLGVSGLSSPIPLGHEEPSECCRLPWPGHDALSDLTLPTYHLLRQDPPPALGSLREGHLWGVSIGKGGDAPVGTAGGSEHPQVPTCCEAYGRTVQAPMYGGRGRGSPDSSWAWLLCPCSGDAQGEVAWGSP